MTVRPVLEYTCDLCSKKTLKITTEWRKIQSVEGDSSLDQHICPECVSKSDFVMKEDC